jgi:hypothetical protein
MSTGEHMGSTLCRTAAAAVNDVIASDPFVGSVAMPTLHAYGTGARGIVVASRGVVFGWDVLSELDLCYLRTGGGGAPIEVDEEEPGPEPSGEPLLEWEPRPEHPFHARLHRLDGGHGVWIEGMGGFTHQSARDGDRPRLTVPPGVDPVRREERVWGIPAALGLIARGDVAVHAAAVEIDGRALVFAGPGRFGKTTLAARLLQDGHRVLAEDLSCIRPGAVPEVLPGPAMLRVRRDVLEGLHIGGAHAVADDPERIHLALEDGLRGSGDPVPLAGILFLRRGTPGVELFRVRADQYLPELWSVSFNLPVDNDRQRHFEKITSVAFSTPLWVLDRPLRFDTLDEVVERLVSTCLD